MRYGSAILSLRLCASALKSNPGGTRSRASAGSVLMESILVMPILFTLIFAIVQFALIWYAQIMTHYAAYNACRAALVYHPADYAEPVDRTDADGHRDTEWKFLPQSGVCYEAACRTLAWVSFSPDGGTGSYGIPGWGMIPASSHIANQVRIDPSKCRDGAGVVLPQVDATYTNLTPSVCVRVNFDYPLHVPVIGKMLAYLLRQDGDYPSHWETTGWSPSAAGIAASESASALHRTMKTDFVTLHAYCVLPKPWATSCFALRPDEKAETEDGGG